MYCTSALRNNGYVNNPPGHVMYPLTGMDSGGDNGDVQWESGREREIVDHRYDVGAWMLSLYYCSMLDLQYLLLLAICRHKGIYGI